MSDLGPANDLARHCFEAELGNRRVHLGRNPLQVNSSDALRHRVPVRRAIVGNGEKADRSFEAQARVGGASAGCASRPPTRLGIPDSRPLFA
jgi:hypothetical protein